MKKVSDAVPFKRLKAYGSVEQAIDKAGRPA
jgi:hypothetical protein